MTSGDGAIVRIAVSAGGDEDAVVIGAAEAGEGPGARTVPAAEQQQQR